MAGNTSTHLSGVPTECANIFLHPRDGGKLVLQPEVHCIKIPCLCPLGKPKRPDAVIETDVDNGCSLDQV